MTYKCVLPAFVYSFFLPIYYLLKKEGQSYEKREYAARGVILSSGSHIYSRNKLAV